MSEDLSLIVRVPNGCGHMTRSVYDELPEPVRARVEILAVCPSEETARWLCSFLPQAWEDVTLVWSSETPEALEIGSERAVGLARPNESREISRAATGSAVINDGTA